VTPPCVSAIHWVHQAEEQDSLGVLAACQPTGKSRSIEKWHEKLTGKNWAEKKKQKTDRTIFH